MELLDEHDKKRPVNHQGMILVRKKEESNLVAQRANNLYPSSTVSYHRDTPEMSLTKFKGNEFRIIVICGRLLEGFNQPTVSVLGIHRKVKSQVVFTQFYGRGLRKIGTDDSVDACLVAHISFDQEPNYKAYMDEEIAESDPIEDTEEISNQ